MPPQRTASTLSTKQPAKTERTHEENQERAYIAASRRSDRSIEARVESARRASEIHKKRTGRSLRVREQDVQNEEMYEEEDDDIPMQYRRMSALYPGQSFTAFDQRLQAHMTAQAGMRNYLHQAIYQANQTTDYHRYMNSMMLQQQQQQQSGNTAFLASPSQTVPQAPWSPTQMAQADQFSNSSPQLQVQSPTYMMPDAGNMSLSLPSPGARRNAANASTSPLSSRPTQSPLQAPTPTSQSGPTFDNSDPFSTTLPINQQQLLDGNPSLARGVHPSQMTPGVPMPSTYHYQFNPYTKANNTPGSEQFAFGRRDLSQTLTPHMVGLQQPTQAPAPQSAPADPLFDDDLLADMTWKENDIFDFDHLDNAAGLCAHNGQTKLEDEVWNPDEWIEIPSGSAP